MPATRQQRPRVVAHQPRRRRAEGVDRPGGPAGPPGRRRRAARPARRSARRPGRPRTAGRPGSGRSWAAGQRGGVDIGRAVDAGVGQLRRPACAQPRPQPGRAEGDEDRIGRPRPAAQGALLGVAEQRRRHVVEGLRGSPAGSTSGLASQRRGELAERARAEDRRADAGLVAHPGQRDRDRRGGQTSAAVATASTMPASSARRKSARLRCPAAARESVGTPARYLPVSTPPPSGEYGSSPTPERGARRARPRVRSRGRAASSAPGSTRSGPGPAPRAARSRPAPIRQPEKLDTPT